MAEQFYAQRVTILLKILIWLIIKNDFFLKQTIFCNQDFFMQKLSQKLRRLRQERGISIRGLSREFGFRSHSYISRIETGKAKPSVEFISKVANFFEVTTEQLVNDEYEIA